MADALRMNSTQLRHWCWLHKWSSLACTVFLLMACVTGLPLIFHDEIDQWLAHAPAYDPQTNTAAAAPVQPMVDESLRRHPGELVASVFMTDELPLVVVVMAPSWSQWRAQPASRHYLLFDVHSGAIVRETTQLERNAVTGFMLKLHRDLFAGLPGELFLGAMALVLLLALVSGGVLYGPYMRRVDFGEVRRRRGSRLKWLDLHNLLGIATLAWAVVVGATGVINEIATPLFGLWQQHDVQAMLQPWQGKPVPSAGEIISVDQAFARARAALPGTQVLSAVYPGSPVGSPFHYQVWTHGDTPLTARLFNPLLIDARSGELAAVVPMPWYLRVLELSRPLHFGDYGGLPLKLLWALLDIVTIVVLGSGLYLWIARHRKRALAPSAGHCAGAPPRSRRCGRARHGHVRSCRQRAGRPG